MKANWLCHWIWIVMEKSLLKLIPARFVWQLSDNITTHSAGYVSSHLLHFTLHCSSMDHLSLKTWFQMGIHKVKANLVGHIVMISIGNWWYLSAGVRYLIQGGLNKMANVLQMTFSRAFSQKKICVFWVKFHWGLFWRIYFDKKSSLFRVMAWHLFGAKPLPEPMMTHFIDACIITRPPRVNTLRPRQDGRHFPDDIFKSIFLNENI